MIACAIDEKITNQQILVLIGSQGCGKTTWLQNLLPEELARYIYRGVMNPNNKDTKLALSESMLMNMDEFSSFSKQQLEAFKEMITQNVVTERRAYGHYCESYPRRASFVGSSNEKEILIDPTGNRRFLCIEVVKIDINQFTELDKAFAQAYQLHKSGFKHYFNQEETERVENSNQSYIKSSTESDLIAKYLRVPLDGEKADYMNCTEIIEYLTSIGMKHRLDPVQLGKLMRNRGFQTQKKAGIQKYRVFKII